MLYARFSTGKHFGGFGASFTPTTISQGTFATFDTEGASAPHFLQQAYAKVDARVTYRIDNGHSVQAFVQNLTDKATLGRIMTGTLSAQGTYAHPRTYGVRVGYRF